MTSVVAIADRRTSADIVFEQLFDQIMSLDLLPGSKISEADIAERFGVSRQPVREAFNRLAGKGLLHVRPQRATQVQQFSMQAIENARFIRKALELELVKRACERWDGSLENAFADNLKEQRRATADGDASAFHGLDEAFHRLIAQAADKEQVFDLVIEQKRMVDRICVLSLKQAHEMALLVDDHDALFSAIRTGKADRAAAVLAEHLGRIEKTIEAVHNSHGDYFET